LRQRDSTLRRRHQQAQALLLERAATNAPAGVPCCGLAAERGGTSGEITRGRWELYRELISRIRFARGRTGALPIYWAEDSVADEACAPAGGGHEVSFITWVDRK